MEHSCKIDQTEVKFLIFMVYTPAHFPIECLHVKVRGKRSYDTLLHEVRGAQDCPRTAISSAALGAARQVG